METIEPVPRLHWAARDGRRAEWWDRHWLERSTGSSRTWSRVECEPRRPECLHWSRIKWTPRWAAASERLRWCCSSAVWTSPRRSRCSSETLVLVPLVLGVGLAESTFRSIIFLKMKVLETFLKWLRVSTTCSIHNIYTYLELIRQGLSNDTYIDYVCNYTRNFRCQ